MTAYKLIQPSDDYWFDAPDDAVATMVVLFLDEMVGWERPNRADADGRPVRFINAGSASNGEAEMIVGEDPMGFIYSRGAEIAAALRTVEIDPVSRSFARVDADVWHDQHRTSTVDYRASAFQYAEQVDGLLRLRKETGLTP